MNALAFVQVSELIMRVLLVDDDCEHRKALARVLARLGADVIDADCGYIALTVMSAKRPDLIITDCQMPGMDGIRLTRALRATGIDLPIIMISGATERATIDAATRAGVTRFLCKPIELADLRDALRQTVGWMPQAA